MTNTEAVDWLLAIESKYISGGDEEFDLRRKEAIGLAIDALNSRTHATWYKNELGHFLCSNCESGYSNQPTCMGKPLFVYCPICGADMRKHT